MIVGSVFGSRLFFLVQPVDAWPYLGMCCLHSDRAEQVYAVVASAGEAASRQQCGRTRGELPVLGLVACQQEFTGHHDIGLIDERGELVVKRRISDDADRFTELLGMRAEAGDSAEEPIPMAIETSRGLLVAALRTTARPAYAIGWCPVTGNAGIGDLQAR